jgi:hypothetical protein
MVVQAMVEMYPGQVAGPHAFVKIKHGNNRLLTSKKKKRASELHEEREGSSSGRRHIFASENER